MDREQENQYIYDEVTKFADKVLDGIDPQKVQISFQLEKLRPRMMELAMELSTTSEDIFIRYMDTASTVSLNVERKFQSTMGNMNSYGDPMWTEQF